MLLKILTAPGSIVLWAGEFGLRGNKISSSGIEFGWNPRVRVCMFPRALENLRKISPVSSWGRSRNGSNHMREVSLGTANSSARGHQSSNSSRIFAIRSRRSKIDMEGFATTARRMPAKASCESRHFLSQEARPLINDRTFSFNSISASDNWPSPLYASALEVSIASLPSPSTCFLSSSTFSSRDSSFEEVRSCSCAHASNTFLAS
mmetsp:Transcript_24113/g.56669  ORF Transcript_24113/g.56669 Transcript_24113/m.56669 type:complete len:206 (+) Transcript_24113:157-774(+)